MKRASQCSQRLNSEIPQILFLSYETSDLFQTMVYYFSVVHCWIFIVIKYVFVFVIKQMYVLLCRQKSLGENPSNWYPYCILTVFYCQRFTFILLCQLQPHGISIDAIRKHFSTVLISLPYSISSDENHIVQSKNELQMKYIFSWYMV